jgi:hypothetical protein
MEDGFAGRAREIERTEFQTESLPEGGECATTTGTTFPTLISRRVQPDPHTGEVAECSAEPGAARRHLADRQGPPDPPDRRRQQ